MDPRGRDMYPVQDHTQAGLEVRSIHTHDKQQYWGPESTTIVPSHTPFLKQTLLPNQVAQDNKERKTILGLSIVVFWGIVLLLFLILAGGIGGGVGAGLASRKNTCSK